MPHTLLRRLLSYGVFLFSGLFALAAQALNTQQFQPHPGIRGGYHLYTSANMIAGQFAFSLQSSYSQNPLEIAATTTTSSRLLGVVDELATADLGLGMGLSDVLAAHISFPMHVYHNVAPTLQPNRDTGSFKTGDLRLALPISITTPTKNASKLGFAIVPFASLPTGDQDIYGGDDSFALGGLLVLEKQISKLFLYGNAGLKIRDAESFLNLTVNDQILYGAGVQYLFTEKSPLSIATEVYGSTDLSAPFDKQDQSPLEVLGVVEKSWDLNDGKRRFSGYLGGGIGLTTGYGSPDYRLVSGVSFAILQKTLQRHLRETIYFNSNEKNLRPEEKKKISQLADFLQKRKIKHIEIMGYSDYYGVPYQTNLNLAKERARKVEATLQGMTNTIQKIDIDSEVIFDSQKSPKFPVPKNRKVEIFVFE